MKLKLVTLIGCIVALNTASVNAYLRRNPSQASQIFNQPNTIQDHYEMTFTVSGDNVYYADMPGDPATDTFHLGKGNNDAWIFIANREGAGTPDAAGDFGCDNIPTYISMNPAPYRCVFTCLTHRQYVVKAHNDTLTLPQIQYYFKRPITPDYSCATSRRLSDEFNPDIQTVLKENDTLIVQHNYSKFYKQ